VGKVRLPSSIVLHSTTLIDVDDDNDDVEDALSPEFRTLLATVTREEVDKYPTRCPHLETSERMVKVRVCFYSPTIALYEFASVGPLAHHPSQRCQGFDRRDSHLRHSQRSCWSWRTCI
jgi:hypothetical protein